MVHGKLANLVPELLLWLIRRRRLYVISGPSMRPTLEPGDRVFLDPRAYAKRTPEPGEVVLARHPDQPLEIAKRVSRVDESGVHLVGDNPEQSSDSRSFGPVQVEALIGRITVRVGH